VFAYEPPAASGSLRRPLQSRTPEANGCPASPPNPEPDFDHVFCDGFESGSIIVWSPQNYETFKDWIYRGSQLLATVSFSEGATHFHLDHLGSARLVTAEVPAASAVAQHTYLPFGGEIPPTNQDRERLKFTGHERDLSNFSSTADDLDYLHARFSSPITGRFLTVDRLQPWEQQFGSTDERQRFREHLQQPQLWNRYGYSLGNPVKYVDPNGQSAEAVVATPLILAGEAAGAASAVVTGGAVVLAAGTGFAIGTAINQIPGVSETVQDALGKALDFVMFAQNTKHNQRVLDGQIAGARINFDKMMGAGGPGKDPNEAKHKGEIKAWLTRAMKIANRLPTKLQRTAHKRILDLAAKAGVTL
jgi:RHS repeat-associated protein